MERIKNKICIITGGGNNIGRAISLLHAREGGKVCIIDIDKSAGEKVADSLNRECCEAIFIQCDVTKIGQINVSVEKIIEKYGRIDILVNNVGGAKGITMEDIDEDSFKFNIDVNLKSAFFFTRAVLPTMKKQNGGSVIFISSINALLGGFSEVAYSSAKGGLHSLMKALVADYSKYGIRFNIVCPGSIPGDSEVWMNREKANPGTLRRLSSLYPLGKYGDPIDVAYAVLFLASEEASWVNGVILPIDGGITATGGLPGGEWWI